MILGFRLYTYACFSSQVMYHTDNTSTNIGNESVEQGIHHVCIFIDLGMISLKSYYKNY